MCHFSLKKWIGVALLFCLAYILCAGVIPFLWHKPVSQDFASSVSPDDFYSDSPCTDRVALVESPEEGLLTRLHILDEATERIDISYYAIEMGDTTDLFLGAILNAADRGVQIRILVDGMFGGLISAHKSYAVALGAHENIELKIYNAPSILKPWTWNGRLHDKYILIDDRLLLLGGRNIGDKYFAPESFDGSVSYDRDVLVYNTAWEETTDGSVLAAVRSYMDEIWDGTHVKLSFQKDTRKGIAQRAVLNKTYQAYAFANPSLFDHTEDDYEGWTSETSSVRLVCNDTNIGVKEPKVGYVLGELLCSAQDSVVLQSPYVIPDAMVTELLEKLGSRDLDVTLLTNSLASSPNPTACTAYWGGRRNILNTGVTVWEYQGSGSIHAKTYLVDNRLSIVGSYNLDPRSAYLDTEMMLVIDSPEFARQMRQTLEEYQQQALEVDRNGEYITNPAVAERDVSFWKRLMVAVLYPLVRLFRGLV